MKELLPQVEHRNCTRHLYTNLQGICSKETLKEAFYAAANATHPQEFKSAMKDMERVSKEAFQKMSSLDPKCWSKAFFESHSKADSTENNMSECFNSFILRCRYAILLYSYISYFTDSCNY